MIEKENDDFYTFFHKQYEKKILKYLRLDEAERKNIVCSTRKSAALKSRLICMAILIAILAYLIATFSYNIKDLGYYLFVSLCAMGISLYLLSDNVCLYKAQKTFSEKLKKRYDKKLADFFKTFGNMKKIVVNNDNLENIKKELKESEIYRGDIDKNSIDDYFVGSYKDVNFQLIEMKYAETYSEMYLIFDMNKQVKNRTIVASSTYIKHMLQGDISTLSFILLFIVISISLYVGYQNTFDADYLIALTGSVAIGFVLFISFVNTRIKRSELMEKMKLEDLKFNNMFASYSSDQIEGRYIITPAFMERLINFKSIYEGKDIRASLYNDKLLIAINTEKNFFEVGNLMSSLTDKANEERLYNEIKAIYDTIDWFKLNEQTKL